MAKKPIQKNPFESAEIGFSKAMNGWSNLAVQGLAAQGQPELTSVVNGLRKFLAKLVSGFFGSLQDIFKQLDPFGAAQGIGAFVSAGIEEMIDTVNGLIDDLLAAPGAAADATIGAVLGLIEAIKKAFHLILDGIKLPALTGPVEIFLDLIDNVLGNIAELLSPKAGKMARRFRNDMYGQLYAVRRADAARLGKVTVVDDMRDEE